MKNILVLSTILLAPRLAVWQIRSPYSMFNGEKAKTGKSAVSRSVFMTPMLRGLPRISRNWCRMAFIKRQQFTACFPNYLVQGGDPLSRNKDRPRLGRAVPATRLPAEIRRKHLRGSVAMGRLPNKINPNRQSNGSQFYVCLQPIPAQDGQDTVFGEVVAGLASLDEISHLQADTNANPIDRVEVIRTYIIDRSQLGHPVQVR